jgi:PAS domain S-box-containing protein
MPAKSLAPKLQFRLHSWLIFAVLLLLIQAALSLTLKQAVILNGYCELCYLLLLLLATGVAVLNAVQNRQAIRLFWAFLSLAFALWALVPFASFYNLVLQGKTLAFLFRTPLIFLHIALMIAAVACRPHLRLPSRRPFRTTLNFLILLFFLVFAFTFLFPYQYVPNASNPIVHFEAIYFAENLLLIVILGILVYRSQPPWKSIYRHLFGASTLYALGSLVNNIVWGLRDPSGDLVGIPALRGLLGMGFTASISWFVWAGLQARKQTLELALTTQAETRDVRSTTLLAMLAVVGIPLAGIWELFRPDEPYATRVARLLIVLITSVLLAVAAFIQAYLANRELASDVGSVNDRLLLAMESGKAVGWEWDLKTGRDSWFGNLESMFGIPSESFGGRPEDFYRYVHPEDRKQVSDAIADAKKTHESYAVEFRVLWPDGTLRWVAAMGRFYYSPYGAPERMLSMAQGITELKLAEQALREREADLTEAQRVANVGSWQWDVETDAVTWSEQLYRIAGLDPSLPALRYQKQSTLYTAESWLRLRSAVEEALRSGTPYELDLEMNCSDGGKRWIVDKGEVRRDSSGRIVQLRGTAHDITERKLAAEALSSVNSRLIEAQESERARIARELHDDIGQRLALLTIDLEQIRQNSPDLPAEFRSRVGVLREQASGVATDVQSLSHKLHSSKLEYLGIVIAIGTFCKEFSDQQKVEVVFAHDEVPRTLPQEISLCLFRVLQEALQNAVKHSGERHFDVELRYASDAIHLAVRDSGSGFEVEKAMNTRGLGLISMAERMKLVDGQLSIDSQPNHGTTILARVPLSNFARAAGSGM